jgi:hypothetical protein
MSAQPPTTVVDVSTLHADLATIEALARLQLRTRRLGRDVLFRHPTDELRELVGFVGLADVLRVEPRRQPEQREEPLGVEEERQLHDPPA